MLRNQINRRQFVQNASAALGAPALLSCARPAKPSPIFTWQGEAFGAPASLQIAIHGNPTTGEMTTRQLDLAMKRCEKAVQSVQDTIAQCSYSFSLYDDSSEISRLNRDGFLPLPSKRLLHILSLSRRLYQHTNGAFDISVQPLWQVAQTIDNGNFTASEMDALWEQARKRIGFDHISVMQTAVKFNKPNMAITLNGIAQGYTTDLVCQTLQAQGFFHYLVNIGEFKAAGRKNLADNVDATHLWSVGIQDPLNPIQLLDGPHFLTGGLATSSSKGGLFRNQLSHIFNTKTGRTGNQKPNFISASVFHASAAIADGLATAFTIMDQDTIQLALDHFHRASAILVKDDGKLLRLSSRRFNRSP